MISLLIKIFIKNGQDVSAPGVKRAYAALSSAVGIVLNLFLCVSKIVIGSASNSIAILGDALNNLSDAGTSLVSLLGFKIAGYGGGSVHPFGHGRIEWIMGIFTSVAVLLMGAKLADSSAAAITSPEKTIFSPAVFIVLILSVLVKGYMYVYNKRFSRITDSETLKATAADCISDSAATLAVLLSAVISCMTGWEIDGYCGVLVAVFIMAAGIKSLWGVLGRIMGKAADRDMTDSILQCAKGHREIVNVHNLMVHDYGFGYFVVSMRVEGYKKDSEQLYACVSEISRSLKQKYHCDCYIQIDYLIEDKALAESLTDRIYRVLQKFGDGISIDNFRLIESSPCTKAAFDLIYPAKMQKNEEEVITEISSHLEAHVPQYYASVKGIIRREYFSLHGNRKSKSGGY